MGQFIMKSYQLQPGDVVTESGLTVAGEGGRDTREVKITKVEEGELPYGEMIAPVHYITGTDLHSSRTVKWCKSPWHRWLANRSETVSAGLVSV
jgi:hypothetical protein